MTKPISNTRMVFYIIGACFVVVCVVIALVPSSEPPASHDETKSGTADEWALYTSALTQHPSYKLVKGKHASQDSTVGVVVGKKTTDAELESLLRFFRLKISQNDYTSIGLAPKSNGPLPSGMLLIFRGEHCVDEILPKSHSPCGYGEHDDGAYQWGAVNSSEHEAGTIRQPDGKERLVFDSKTPIPFPQAEIDQMEAVKSQQRESRRLVAAAIQKQFNYFSNEYSVYPGDEGKDLTIQSDEFNFEADRDRFMRAAYPKLKAAVCTAGFAGVRLRPGLLDDGTLYDPSC